MSRFSLCMPHSAILKVLIIDDDPLVLDIYSHKFKERGIAVEKMRDSEATVERIRAYAPTIILLDLVMPSKDGLTLLKEIRENSATRDYAVLLVTNTYEEERIERGMELGALGYLIKAIHTPSEVVEKTKEILDRVAGTTP